MLNKSRYLLALTILLTLSGCAALDKMAGLPVNEGNGYAIEHERKIYGGGVHIEYRDPELLENEIRTQMENRMASESELQDALDRIPEGGRIFVHYEATTVEAANTEWLEYVLFKDGEEVYRRKGKDQIAEVPTSYSGGIGFWWNIDAIDLRQPIKVPFKFIVISNLKDQRDTFTISRP
ncbi:MAG: hypothetical protein HLUCCX14_08345 [Marinobacter excellens HL-55]|uniref:Lipoprotein n=1 Tax=Marinobacter excellens HL-55 TaxID=1305731 RepID=A0A0P7YEF8_9GAMM|nr:MAG: hypothetical protein HLUCCX14_08345 [Marinobacter excellens HL-55]